jgi:hypothetical protein
MTAFREWEGAVSSEQRRSNGSAALAACARNGGAASIAMVDATSLRRDNDQTIFVLLTDCVGSETGAPLAARPVATRAEFKSIKE